MYVLNIIIMILCGKNACALKVITFYFKNLKKFKNENLGRFLDLSDNFCKLCHYSCGEC